MDHSGCLSAYSWGNIAKVLLILDVSTKSKSSFRNTRSAVVGWKGNTFTEILSNVISPQVLYTEEHNPSYADVTVQIFN